MFVKSRPTFNPVKLKVVVQIALTRPKLVVKTLAHARAEKLVIFLVYLHENFKQFRLKFEKDKAKSSNYEENNM